MARITRYLLPQVRKDLARKMVFVAGPGQVGKTTLARSLNGGPTGFLIWDVAQSRERILKGELPPGKLWIFDEIHKYRRWRNYLKGLYDGRARGQRILVTGSARLDLYRFGGDSLQGRYHLLRLHPLSVAELGLSAAGSAHWSAYIQSSASPHLVRRASARSKKSRSIITWTGRLFREKLRASKTWSLAISSSGCISSRTQQVETWISAIFATSIAARSTS